MVSYNYHSTIFLTTAAYFNALLHIFTVTKNLVMLYFMLYPNNNFYILDLFSNSWRGCQCNKNVQQNQQILLLLALASLNSFAYLVNYNNKDHINSRKMIINTNTSNNNMLQSIMVQVQTHQTLPHHHSTTSFTPHTRGVHIVQV